MMNFTDIIFDLDGTLIDSRPEIIRTYREVFNNILPPRKIIESQIDCGAPLVTVLEEIYEGSTENVLKAGEAFKDIYDNSGFQETVLYPDVPEIINVLYEKGFRLHVATNKRMIPTLKILQVKGLFHFFRSIKTSDSSKNKLISKQAMLKEISLDFGIKNGVMVGDSIQDIEAGNSLNFTTVAALYGYEKKGSLLKKNPKFAINKFNELRNILLTI